MYLSRVELDLTRRSTMEALAAPQKLHGAVESAFAGERRRRLWRLDRLGERLYLLLLSEDAPDLSGVVEQFGTGAAAETRSYDPLLERVVPGSCWQFRLTANPTKSRKDPKAPAERGSVMAHCSEAVAAGSGGKARLCPAGGGIYRDPSAVAALCQARHPASDPAGRDLRGRFAGDGCRAVPGDAVSGDGARQGLWSWTDDRHARRKLRWTRCRASSGPTCRHCRR